MEITPVFYNLDIPDKFNKILYSQILTQSLCHIKIKVSLILINGLATKKQLAKLDKVKKLKKIKTKILSQILIYNESCIYSNKLLINIYVCLFNIYFNSSL